MIITTSTTDDLYQIDNGRFCFGAELRNGIVVRTAPVARRFVGRPFTELLAAWSNAIVRRCSGSGAAEGVTRVSGTANTPKRAQCRSCGADVVWVTTEAGRPMCLDPGPYEDGNVVRVGQGQIRVLGKGEAYRGLRYRAHVVSCPYGADWRRSSQ